jgi:hypothetical protein
MSRDDFDGYRRSIPELNLKNLYFYLVRFNDIEVVEGAAALLFIFSIVNTDVLLTVGGIIPNVTLSDVSL